MSSTSAALGVPELLEAVLVELPFKDLLRVRRVCKYWRASIKDSVRLQRALYFKSAPVSASVQTSEGFTDCMLALERPKSYIATDQENPLFYLISPRGSNSPTWKYPLNEIYRAWVHSTQADFPPPPLVKMLIYQPPPTAIGYETHKDHQNYCGFNKEYREIRTTVIVNAQGVTIEDVFQGIHDVWAGEGFENIGFFWNGFITWTNVESKTDERKIWEFGLRCREDERVGGFAGFVERDE